MDCFPFSALLGISLDELSLEEYRKESEAFDEDIYQAISLTACVENLAMLGQYLGHFSPALERQLYQDYLMPSNADHRKQRGRIAPDRERSKAYLQRLMAATDPLGMSVSICYWVRKQLDISEELIPLVNRNGFQCLGYEAF